MAPRKESRRRETRKERGGAPPSGRPLRRGGLPHWFEDIAQELAADRDERAGRGDGGPSDEDAAQEALLEALGALRSGVEVRCPRAWLRAILRRRNRRAQERRRSQGLALREWERRVRRTAPDPAELAVRREEAHRVRAALEDAVATWPEPYASILNWRFVEERPPREVAARLSAWTRSRGRPISPHTARGWLKRAVRALRNHLAGEGPPPGPPRDPGGVWSAGPAERSD